jgi:hypothetical protein
LARLLHYSKAKGGRHENQDQCEGWNPEIFQLKPYNVERREADQRKKGGRDENQDEREGWNENILAVNVAQRRTVRI